MENKIYVVEDDDGISEVYQCAFESAGYDMECFSRAEDMFDKLGSEKLPSLIVLDIMLPKMDGLTALKVLKKSQKYESIPVVLISAKSEEHIKVNALVSGAEDYITKPFGIMELVARVNKIIARNKNVKEVNLAIYREIRIDDKKHKIYVNDNELELTPKCYEILKYLVIKQGEVIRRDELFDVVWGEEYFPEARTLDIHINAIRQELSKYTSNKYVKTIRGVGFTIGE